MNRAKSLILIVDDVPDNLDILFEVLHDDYEVAAAKNGEKAVGLAQKLLPDLILMDIMMPEMDGFEACRHLKQNPLTDKIPLIFLTAADKLEHKKLGFELGAVDYITKPFEIPEILARVKNHIEIKQLREQLEQDKLLLEKKVDERTREIEMLKDSTILSLAAVAETRDPDTGDHLLRTQRYMMGLALAMGENSNYKDVISNHFVELLFKSTPLHDIGKVGVPDSILLKPGSLTEDEFEEMKKHTEYGLKTLKTVQRYTGDNEFIMMAQEIAYTHHEKWNGKGYPRGLTGQEIPLSGRLMAVADVYDALISERVYKASIPHDEACAIIIEGKGSHFDPEVIEAFEKISEQFRMISLQYKSKQ